MTTITLIEPVRTLRHAGRVTFGSNASSFTLENDGDEATRAEIVLDYQQCEGGLPIFEIVCTSGQGSVDANVVYSEGIGGIDHATGKLIKYSQWLGADEKQATDPSSYSPMLWIHTAAQS